jgi:hypothetical protein
VQQGEVRRKHQGAPTEAAYQPDKMIHGPAGEPNCEKGGVPDKPTVIMSEQIPDDMKPTAEEQGQDARERRFRRAGTEGEESVAVGIWESGDDGSANLPQDPKRQETNGQAEHETTGNRMGKVIPIINTTSQVRSEATDDEGGEIKVPGAPSPEGYDGGRMCNRNWHKPRTVDSQCNTSTGV